MYILIYVRKYSYPGLSQFIGIVILHNLIPPVC